MGNKNNDNNSYSLKTKWGNRFIIAAIIQGGIITGMALGTVAFQLLTTDIDIIQFLSLSFEGSAKWFFIGIILYLILIVAIAVTAVFYNHLEINLKRKFSKVSNILAWIHLFGMNIGGAGTTILIIFQYMYMCPKNTIEIQMNFYPNPDEQWDTDDCGMK